MAAELTPAVCRWCSRPIIWSGRLGVAHSTVGWRESPNASDICDVRVPRSLPATTTQIRHQPELPDLRNPVHVRTWLDLVD